MNVHVNQIVGGIFQLALMERLKYDSDEKVKERFMAVLPVLIAPSAMQHYEKGERVLFIRNDRIHQFKHSRYVYPTKPTGGEPSRVPLSDRELIGREINIDLFQSTNFLHSGYHALKAHLIIRKNLYAVLSSYVDIKRRGGQTSYRVWYDGTQLSAEELEKEIAIFEEAVLIFIANSMKSRYNNDGKALREYCFKQIQQLVPSVPNVWVDEMLKAISIPDRVQQQLVRDDYIMSQYESKLCGKNLYHEVAKFVARAYEAVYAEI